MCSYAHADTFFNCLWTILYVLLMYHVISVTVGGDYLRKLIENPHLHNYVDSIRGLVVIEEIRPQKFDENKENR